MKYVVAGVATIALLLAAVALAQPMHQQQAQQNQQQQQHQQQEQQKQMQQHMEQQKQMQQMQHMQQEPTRTMRMMATKEEMDGVMQHMRQLGDWMEHNNAPHAYREMAMAMVQAGDRLQFMLKKMDQVCQDPQMQKDEQRMQSMDQLQERLRIMTREMKQSHDLLEQMAGAPS